MKTTQTIFTLFVLLFFAACKDKPCENKDCGQFGICIEVDKEAECQCDDGFEKDGDGKCEIFSISSYTGIWSVADSCNNNLDPGDPPPSATYEITINQISFDQIELVNLSAEDCEGGFLTVEAIVDGNTFALKPGSYCQSTSSGVPTEFQVMGAGTISTEGIKMSYNLIFDVVGTSTVDESCIAILTKQ